jgi:hypothetical protein
MFKYLILLNMTSLQAKRKDELLITCNEKKISGVYKKKKEEIIELLDAVHITKDESDYLQNYDRCDIFTPDDISQLMASKLAELVASPRTLLEPSVGTGNLLKYIPLDLYESIDVFDIKAEYMASIAPRPNLNKRATDFLKYAPDPPTKYSSIILNPPYIKIQELPTEYTQFIRQTWPIFKAGNIDLYYVFLMKCIELLEEGGAMVAITPNTYLHNKSSTNFRKYLFENRFIKEIIDFKDQKVFGDASVYCCITVITKAPKATLTYNDQPITYDALLSKENRLHLLHYDATPNTKTLCDICNIYNGIATLRDNIFIHPTKLYDEPCWKKVITAKKDKFAIFPYNNGTVIPEDAFKAQNPLTHAFLMENKGELAKRDCGRVVYPEWYSYGRTQSLNISKKERVIYMPVFFEPKGLTFRVEAPALHISCLCIEPARTEDIDFIINTIKNNMDYIKKNSSVKNNGWINVSSTILKTVPINH